MVFEDFNDNKIPAYLIEADQVGIGTYGEPVGKNIKIIRELKYIELVQPKPEFKMDMRIPQLQ